MVLLAHRVTVVRVRMPGEPPAAVDVAVVLVPEDREPADERRDEGDVGERAADEVVAAVVGPAQPVRETEQEHGLTLRRAPVEASATADRRSRRGSRTRGTGARVG